MTITVTISPSGDLSQEPSWIQALTMIMVLCLFVYAMTEFRLRRNLQETGETVTGKTKKQTQNPTPKWMFFRFHGVRVLRFRASGTRGS